MACGGGSPATAMIGADRDSKVNIKRPVIFMDDLPWDWLIGEWTKALFVEVRIEDTNLGNLRDWQLAANRRAPHSLRRRSVVKTKRTFAIGSYVGVQPGDPVFRIAINDVSTQLGAGLIERDVKTVWELSFNKKPGHVNLSSANLPSGIMGCWRDRRIAGSTQFRRVAYPHCRGEGSGLDTFCACAGDGLQHLQWSYSSATIAWPSLLIGSGARSRMRGALLCLARKQESERRRFCRNSPRQRLARGCYGVAAMRCSRPVHSVRYTTSHVRHRATSWPPLPAMQTAKSYSRRPLTS